MINKIVIHSQDHLRFISEEDILFCKSDNCYTYIILHTSEELLISKSLAKFSKELNENNFIRVNQSYLVNKQYIRSIDKKKKLLHLTNMSQIPFTSTLKDLLIRLERVASVIIYLTLYNVLVII